MNFLKIQSNFDNISDSQWAFFWQPIEFCRLIFEVLENEKSPVNSGFFEWSWWRDSNPRPLPYQGTTRNKRGFARLNIPLPNFSNTTISCAFSSPKFLWLSALFPIWQPNTANPVFTPFFRAFPRLSNCLFLPRSFEVFIVENRRQTTTRPLLFSPPYIKLFM